MSLPLGKLIGVPILEYHGADAISSTKLKVAAESLLLFRQMFIDRIVPPRRTDAMDFGSAFHLRCESAASYLEGVIVNTKFDSWRTNEAKAWRAEREGAGIIVLDPEEHDTIHRMWRGFLRNPTAVALMADTEREVTWRARAGQFYVQCRTDRWSEAGCTLSGGEVIGPYALDFKTVASLSEGSFIQDVARRDYHFSSEFYKEVIALVKGLGANEPRPRFFFVVPEKDYPNDCEVYELDADTSLVARSSVILTLRRVRRAYETGQFTGRPGGITTIGLPMWRVKEAERELEAARRQLTE